MKKKLLLAIIFNFLFEFGFSQTFLSGGIFSSMTFTMANSPYIVTSNVVVFPGVTITIQPGVVIKFNNGTNLEIRQSSIIANGSVANPIVFTSNDSFPSRGSWDYVFLNQSPFAHFDYCEFYYANNAITGQSDNLSVVNCKFSENILGMDAQSNIYIRIDSCTFKNNNSGQTLSPGYYMSVNNCKYINNSIGLYAQTGCSVINCIIDSNSTYGLLKHMACNDTIRNNEIKYNGAGISHDFSGCGGTVYIYNNIIDSNNVGILIQNTGGSQQIEIYNNSICSNYLYNIQNITSLNLNAMNNCWCSNNLSYIESTIFDAYDNGVSGIVSYSPINNGICTVATGANTNQMDDKLDVNVIPNPFSTTGKLKFENSNKLNFNLIIYDSVGKEVRNINNIVGEEIEISRIELYPGLYLFHLFSDNNIFKTGKFSIK